MRVSEYYKLGRTQPTLDFVDVDVEKDTPVYIDPSTLKNLPDEWSSQCHTMLSTFFHSVVDAINAGDQDRLRELLVRLQEPNETHFGLSKGKSRGRGLGPYLVQRITNNLVVSRAAETGLLEDLEDTALFIEGIGKDIISDVTTNIIRGMLISYTQSMASIYGMELQEGVYSGLVWNPSTCDWEEGNTRMLLPGTPLLLVPKVIVRHDLHLTKEDYFRNHLAPTLQDEELDKPGSKLVQTAKTGRKFVTKMDVEMEYGGGKEKMVDLTLTRSQVFHTYKEEKRKKPSRPLDHDELSAATGTKPVSYQNLLTDVLDTPPGVDNATIYHHKVHALLSAIFYPWLTYPVVEHPLDQSRKRVDITYTNNATDGFFGWITRQGHPSSHIFVECKNYHSELGNPELDQLCGRFSPLRGKVGLLLCRSLADKEHFLQRCRDTALSRHEFVLLLDDDDLSALVDEVVTAHAPVDPDEIDDGDQEPPYPGEFRLLFERFRKLVS
ncbi:hypothetical protein [Streptomyces sp. NBC_00019]|uniref:hypothetical protein n=1 Tax=Streptomyces sp. NBC_00019 TaxID=2975623 RepID=UPI003247669F